MKKNLAKKVRYAFFSMLAAYLKERAYQANNKTLVVHMRAEATITGEKPEIFVNCRKDSSRIIFTLTSKGVKHAIHSGENVTMGFTDFDNPSEFELIADRFFRQKK